MLELLVVVLIIGILASVGFLEYQKVMTMTRAAQLETAVRSVINGQELYYSQKGRYSLYMKALQINFSQLPLKKHPYLDPEKYKEVRGPSKGSNDCFVYVFGEKGNLNVVGIFDNKPYQYSGFWYLLQNTNPKKPVG